MSIQEQKMETITSFAAFPFIYNAPLIAGMKC